MYPLPPRLSNELFALFESQDIDAETQMILHDHLAAMLVRENRMMRKEVAQLQRDFKEASDREDGDYADIRSAAAGEFTCEHIINTIIKPHVYYNTEEAEKRRAAVEDLIQQLNDEEV